MDNKNKQGWQDDTQVNLDQPYELAYAARTMHCTQKKIREAIKAVGNSRKKIAQWVKENPDTKPIE